MSLLVSTWLAEVRRRRVHAGCIVSTVLLVGFLSACTGRGPAATATVASTPPPPATSAEVVTTPVPATPEPEASVVAAESPAAEATLAARRAQIPAGVYAMLDWNRNAANAANTWIKGGHNAFTWRQVQPERDKLDWGVVDRWLDAEAGPRDAPSGRRVGLGVDAYDGLDSSSAPQWVLDDFPLGGYVTERRIAVAASEHAQAERRPALLLSVEPAGGGAAQLFTLRQGQAGYADALDTWLDGANPQAAHGGEQTLALGAAGQANLLLQFGVSGLPAGAKVVSATLALSIVEFGGDMTPLAVEAYPLARAWDATTATWLAPQPNETWTIRGANGFMAEADRTLQSAGGSVARDSASLLIGLDQSIVQTWIDHPETNRGLLVKQHPGDIELPRYFDGGFMQAYAALVKAFGERYGDDPRVAWVEATVGIYGETTPTSKPALKWSYAEAGLTSMTQAPEKGLYSWVETVKEIIDLYKAAFPAMPLFLEYSNNFESVSERGVYVPYAVERGIGLKHNGLYPDSIDGATQGGPAVGTYNIMFTYSETVPVAWEFQVFPRTPDNVYWAMLNALDKHADFVMVQKEAITSTALIPIFDFANRFLGATLETTPAAWVALRETERPAERWNTQHGNFSFWMQQIDTAPASKTLPLWKVTDAKEGLFTRSTDQASGNRYMAFDVDDGYFHGGRPISIEVVYLDRGRDAWHLEYDAGGRAVALPPVQKADTNAWKTATFSVSDAALAGGVAGNDLRIDCEGDGDEIIHMVMVAVQGR